MTRCPTVSLLAQHALVSAAESQLRTEPWALLALCLVVA